MPLQKWSDQIWICQMSPEPSFSEEIDAAISQYKKADEKPHVVIDLAGVDTLNSTNLSQMLRLRELTQKHERGLRLAHPSNAVWSLILTASLDKVFTFSQDTMMALAELQIDE